MDDTSISPPPSLSAPSLAGLAGASHGFFTRVGGVSGGIYASLNCGFGSSDDRAAVAENRRRAAAALGIAPERLVTAYQVHGSDVATVTGPWRPGDGPRADGMASRTPGIALGVLAADCAPVLFCDPVAGVIGACHAGWRGALAGITDATIGAMTALGARSARVRAALGPCIAQPSYETGAEFRDAFLAADARNDAFFVAADRAGHFRFDLPGYVLARLEGAGLDRVERIALDSCAEESRLFSYRRSCLRGEADFGRGLSAIALL
jgi:YfiH family protein